MRDPVPPLKARLFVRWTDATGRCVRMEAMDTPEPEAPARECGS